MEWKTAKFDIDIMEWQTVKNAMREWQTAKDDMIEWQTENDDDIIEGKL